LGHFIEYLLILILGFGKSTLLRAMVGIWKRGKGMIHPPEDAIEKFAVKTFEH
jgi:ABC-type uncharacterized transport system fused permease/ATPase subunit